MVAIVIFWASVMAIIFFVLGALLKGLTAAVRALEETGELLGAVVLLLGLGITVLAMIGMLVQSLMDGNFFSTLLGLCGFVFVALIVIGIVMKFGEVILGILLWVVNLIETVLEWCAYFCEKVYVHFLQVIINQLAKC